LAALLETRTVAGSRASRGSSCSKTHRPPFDPPRPAPVCLEVVGASMINHTRVPRRPYNLLQPLLVKQRHVDTTHTIGRGPRTRLERNPLQSA